MRRCKNCGRLVEDHIAMCPFCGKSPEAPAQANAGSMAQGSGWSGGSRIPEGPAGPDGRRIPDGPGYPAGYGRGYSGPPPAGPSGPGRPGSYSPGPGMGYGPAGRPDYNKKRGMSPGAKKKLIIGTVAGSLLLIGIIVGIVLFMRARRTVNLEDAVTIEYSGVNEYGEANAYLDQEKLNEALSSAMGSRFQKFEGEDIFFRRDSVRLTSAYYSLIDGIKVSCDKTEGLKNGDKVHVKIEYGKDANDAAGVLGIILKGSEKEDEVKGLKDAEVYSPLDGDYEVEFDGRAPYASARVVYTGEKGGIYDDYFHLDKTDKIKLGDSLKVSFDPSQIDEKEAAADGYIIDKKKTEVEYKVKAENIDYYVSTVSDVNDQVLASLQPRAEKAILDYFDDINEYVSIGEPQYAACYVFMSKYQETYDANNYVDLIYTIQVTSREGAFKTQTIYIPIEFEDVIVEKGGQVPERYASSPLGETDLEYNLNGWGTSHVKGYKNKKDMERELANDKGNNFAGSVTKGFQDE